MVKFIRSGQIAPGKGAEAVAYAKNIANHLNQSIGINFEIFSQLGGDVGKLYWVGDFESLAAMEVAIQKINTDPEYGKMVIENTDKFMPGSFHDTILTSM